MAYWNWQLHNYCVFCRCLSSVRLALFALIIPKIRLFLSRYHVFLRCFSCVALHCTWIISWHVDPPAPDPVCSSNLQTMLHACNDPGFTTNPSKTIGPCTCLELLGIVIDSVLQEARKSGNHWFTPELALLQIMHEATTPIAYRGTVCRPGRTFLRRLIDLLDSARHPSHHIRLTKCSLKDICWWLKFLQLAWNGCSFFYNTARWTVAYKCMCTFVHPCL